MVAAHTTHFETDAGNLILFKRVVLNNIGESTTLHVLHDDPELIAANKVRLQEVDNVRMLRLLHDENLVHNELYARLTRQIHFLDRDFLACCEHFCDIDMTRSTVEIP